MSMRKDETKDERGSDILSVRHEAAQNAGPAGDGEIA